MRHPSTKSPPPGAARGAERECVLRWQCMDDAGVDGALIVQPINHKFDHSYVQAVMQAHPSKFVGACLADPAVGGGGVKVQYPCRACRLPPDVSLWFELSSPACFLERSGKTEP
jgi:hypothetical protein